MSSNAYVQHHGHAGVARSRHFRACAMPAVASWSITAPLAAKTVIVTDPKPRPRPLVTSQ
jgi:hypothetical protein